MLVTGVMIPSLERGCQIKCLVLFDKGTPLSARGADTLADMGPLPL